MNLTPGQTLPSNQMNNQISNSQIHLPQTGYLGQSQAQSQFRIQMLSGGGYKSSGNIVKAN